MKLTTPIHKILDYPSNLVKSYFLHQFTIFIIIDEKIPNMHPGSFPGDSRVIPGGPGQAGTGIDRSKLTLRDFFDNKEEYDFIMNYLVEQKMISPFTLKWILGTKGDRKVIIALLKDLQVLGYYRLNQKLTNFEIRVIAWNTFGVDISIDSIKHGKYDDIIFKNIPPAKSRLN